LAFAYEQPVGVVDTNVGRVLARWRGRPLTTAEAQATADTLAATAGAGRAWSWNQTIMELGAVVCGRRRPVCDECPVRAGCGWHAACGPRGEAPDPADGSAGVGKGQSKFEGSDRQGRGRLVDALRQGPVAHRELPRVMGWPDDPDRAQRVAKTVIADGLAATDGTTLRLP
jgi:A/G-specific adenine glycosylase